MNSDIEKILQEYYRIMRSYKNRINELKTTPEVKEFLRLQDRLVTLYDQVKLLEDLKKSEEISRK